MTPEENRHSFATGNYPMQQNIYDNDQFYAGYSQLPRSREGLLGAPEWPSVRALLPRLDGRRILDLGCGFGAFDRWAVEQGADSVVALDISENMLRRARELTRSNLIDYRQGDMTTLDIAEDNFDLIYSALAFHYVPNIHNLCSEIRAKLSTGGHLVATVEHPIFSAPEDDSWREDENRRSFWPLDNYLNEGPRIRNWFADGVIKYHRTVESYVTALLSNGFQLTHLIEWGPDREQLMTHPEWERERDRPMFLLFSAIAA